MIKHFSRRMTGTIRSDASNRELGYLLAFIAGAVNAGGFLAVQKYTSHMTGIVSSMADFIALGQFQFAVVGFASLVFFVAGAAMTAIMVNYARRHKMTSEYAAALLVEAALLMAFGLLGARAVQTDGTVIISTVLLLSFIMGLQNAVITKVSGAVIRTTHVTGIVTDIGIELGKFLYKNVDQSADIPRVVANRDRLKMLAILLTLFFTGGVAGAVGFKTVGYIATVPLALLLVLAAIVPVIDDIAAASQNRKK